MDERRDVVARVRTPKTGEVIASQLRRQIADGRLRPGDSLPPENRLAENFGVSRPTLREALRVLESQGLLVTQQGSRSGIRVQTPRTDALAVTAGMVLEYRGATIADVFEAQEIIEPACAGRLASVATPKDLQLLWAAIAAESDGTAAPPDLHRLVVDLAGNETIAVMVALVRPILDATGWSCLARKAATAQQRGRWLAAHRAVVEFINSHDSDSAENAWRNHLAEVNSVFVAGPHTVLDILDPPL